ncbi:hypothetical protein DFS34DRAFT_648523 [Phlyctochytrium arcticum]|nr:hypothetical protein DFS34DRAFT_648523 [Phlyctochytrium arcticum]
MPEAVNLELYTWGPAYNLPSFDPFCLTAETYLQFISADWVVNECNNPDVAPTGELPMLRDGPFEPVVGSRNIIRYLKKKVLDLDEGCPVKQKIDTASYTSLVEDKLYDALLYNWWLDAKNVNTSTKPTLSKALRGIAGFRIPTQLQRRAEFRLKAYKSKEEVYRMARECYAALACKLGDQSYFFGQEPSSLDAVVFGHLALHCVPNLAEPTLFSIITFEYPTLYAYCDRIRTRYFSQPLKISPNLRPSFLLGDMVRSPMTYLKSLVMRQRVVETSGEKERAKRDEDWKTALAIVGAVGFFVGFIWQQGIIQITYGDDEDAEEERYHGVDDVE